MICWPGDAVIPGAGGDLTRAELDRRFHALLDAHGAALGRLAGSYARNSGESEDLLQEIAIAIWRALPGFREECSERTFVFRIAHNRGMSHLVRRRLPVVDVDGDVSIADAALNPEASLSANEQGRRLKAAIRRLPVGHRQVITLALEGLSYAEIGQVLGITESNVGVRLTRARQLLRGLMQAEPTAPNRLSAAAAGGMKVE